jgi:hypothetical protein
MTTFNTLPVHAAAPTPAHFRLPVHTTDGSKTSVSLPVDLFATYVKHYGTRRDFREALTRICKTLTPRPGYSRSMAVRLALEAELAQGAKPGAALAFITSPQQHRKHSPS